MRYYLVKKSFNDGMDRKEHLKGERLIIKNERVFNNDGEYVFCIDSANYNRYGEEVSIPKWDVSINNPGLNRILNFLKSEEERFIKAGTSGTFCDSINCLNTAQVIRWAIWDIEESMKSFNFDVKND